MIFNYSCLLYNQKLNKNKKNMNKGCVVDCEPEIELKR